jgi:hypothetical protein
MSDKLMHFGNGPRLAGSTLLGLAVALVVVVATIVFIAKRNDDDGLALLALVVGATCLAGLWSAGAWSEVTIDPAKREVVSRFGFLGLGAGSTHPFADYKAVLVTLKRESETEAVTTTGSGFHKTASRTRTSYSYMLSLDGYVTGLDLPLKGDAKSPDEAEARALEVARAGGWPARRRGYAVDPGSGGRVHQKVAFDAQSPLEP